MRDARLRAVGCAKAGTQEEICCKGLLQSVYITVLGQAGDGGVLESSEIDLRDHVRVWGEPNGRPVEA